MSVELYDKEGIEAAFAARDRLLTQNEYLLKENRELWRRIDEFRATDDRPWSTLSDDELRAKHKMFVGALPEMTDEIAEVATRVCISLIEAEAKSRNLDFARATKAKEG